MLIELAVGDAYGAGFEYAPETSERRNDLSRYVRHPTHRIVPGRYTDDTQMSIAVAEVLLSGEAWTPHALADAFVRAFKRDPREGYASRFYAFLRSVRDGSEFLERIEPWSDKSGAAMRAAPIGIMPTPEQVIARCVLQAELTHNTPDGIAAANAAALAVHYVLYRHGPKSKLGAFIETYVPGRRWSDRWRGRVGSKGWMSVHAAITAVMEGNRLSDILKRSIAFNGDVDTVGSIALAAASCSGEIEQDLPERLYADLERGPYGYDYLAKLDAGLRETMIANQADNRKPTP